MSPLVQVFSAISAVLVWVITWYFGTAQEVSSIWWRSDTFAHGLLVLPISGWLAWRNKDRLVSLSKQPSLVMLLDNFPLLANAAPDISFGGAFSIDDAVQAFSWAGLAVIYLSLFYLTFAHRWRPDVIPVSISRVD